MAEFDSTLDTGLSVLMLGNEDLVSEFDSSFSPPSPLSPPDDDPRLALDHAEALRATPRPLAPEPLA